MPGGAHPRSRGEHKLHQHHRRRILGSSPLARGTLIKLDISQVTVRLIPARAGNTLSSTGKSLRRPAHPRSRGEHVLFQALVHL